MLSIGKYRIAIHTERMLLPSPLIIIPSTDGESEGIWQASSTITPPFALAVIEGISWNDDLSPWPFTPGKGSAFGGQADSFLEDLEQALIPAVLPYLPSTPTSYAIAGYSLAGLFAMYAAFRTRIFRYCMSVSGSLWYPGFREYAGKAHECSAELAYLSLGNHEGDRGSALMRTVGKETGMICSILREIGVETVYEINPGGHFTDPPGRIAKAIACIATKAADHGQRQKYIQN